MSSRRFLCVLVTLLLCFPLVAAAQASVPEPADLIWVRTGGPIGGLGYDIRMHPENPDLLYVTDAFAGAFISEDGGQNWQASNEGITARTGPTGDAIPVFSLTIDPNDPNIIWIGTQNARGIYKSIDGGRTWEERTRGIVEQEGISFRGFAVDPTSSDIVYAAAEINSWTWAGTEVHGREFDMTQGVVYKTTDGGARWTPVWRGDNLARYVVIDPRNSDVLYISTGIFDREAANSEPATRTPGGEGILKSTDGGETWASMNSGLGNLYVGSLFMHPTDPDVLLAGTANNQYYDRGGAYITTNGGETWTQTLNVGVESVEFSSSDPNIAYALGSSSVHRSSDGGRTWMLMAGGLGDDRAEPGWGPPGVRAGFPIDIQVDPRDPDRLFANNYGGGNFLSDDGGRTWEIASRGYTGAQIRDLAVAEPGRVYVAARSGLFVTRDGGGEWPGMLGPNILVLEWNAIAVDPADPEHLVAGTNWASFLAESHDGGRSWEIVLEGREMTGWRALAFAPSDPSFVYAGAGAFVSAGGFADDLPAPGVFVSRDGGTTWGRASDGVASNAHVASLAVHPGDPGIAYAATTRHGLLRTADGGETWSQLPTGVDPSISALSVAVSPTDPNVVVAGFAFDGVRRSTDGGNTWQRVAAGITPESFISAIVFDPADPSTVYAADVSNGMLRSADGGETWVSINEGLRTRAVSGLAISGDGCHLYAGTDGEGVFRLDVCGEPPAVVEGPVEEPPEGETPTSEPVPATSPEEDPPVAAQESPEEGDPGPVGGLLVGIALASVLAVAGLWVVIRRRSA